MVSDLAGDSILLSSVHEGREGIILERTFSALSFLLHGWSTFKGKRKPLYDEKDKRKEDKEDIEPLPVIHFEKLALLVSRIWKEMFSIEEARRIMDSSKQIKDSNIVTFPFPLQEVPAKHGRRLRRWIGKKKWVYIVQILHELQKADIHYFEIKTHPDASDNPNDYRTIVKPAFPITNNKEFLRGFNSIEIEILENLENSLKHLGASQIRALGTHENREKTIYDIKKEFRDMKRYILLVINSLNKGDCFFDNSYEIMTYADEAWRKSIYNRDDYKEARELMLTEIKNHKLQVAFQACQKLPEQIWGADQAINNLTQISEKAKAFTKYLHAIAYYRNHVTERVERRSMEAREFGHLWDEGLEEMGQCGLKTFPSNIHEVFIDHTGKIKSRVHELLIRELESLHTYIKENIKHA